jgi:hypothetical protein
MHGPMGRYTFVAMLFLMAVSCFLIGGTALYDNAMFRFKGEDAVMVATDPAKWLVVRDGRYFSRAVNVKFVTAGGREIAAPGKHVSADEVRRLAADEKIPMRFIDGDPVRSRIAGDDGDNPWIWLAAGVAALGLALFARKLLHRESRQG